MRIPRRTFLHLAGTAVFGSAFPITARAQSYPTRPITIGVPYPAGGPSDTVIRRRASVLVCHFRFPMEEWER
jgi:tripartite-type tricarboxylate transporter receptor subunit TctC